MTEEQRVKLEELITEYGNSEWNLGMEANPTSISKARDRITKHLDMIQWSAALYNFQRFGVKDLEDLDLREWEKKSPVFMDVDNKDEDNAGCDLPKYLVESPIEKMSKVGKNLDEEEK